MVPVCPPRNRIFIFSQTGFICSFGACPGTRFVDQTGLEITEFCLLLPPSAGIKGVCHHRRVFFVVVLFCLFFETWFLCVTVLPVPELTL